MVSYTASLSEDESELNGIVTSFLLSEKRIREPSPDPSGPREPLTVNHEPKLSCPLITSLGITSLKKRLLEQHAKDLPMWYGNIHIGKFHFVFFVDERKYLCSLVVS